ncbi:Transcription factor, fungi [Penicillium expansum]|nr:Transcription factor, fungi [Penicillium expansum]
MDRRKYWDENYVKSLENQVQALLALQNSSTINTIPHIVPRRSASTILDSSLHLAPLGKSHQYEHCAPLNYVADDETSHQSQTAMEELSVMMWRTNLADAVAPEEKQSTKNPPTRGNILQPEAPPQVPPQILNICGEVTRIYEVAALFLKCINEDHQFTQYESSDFFLQFPNQSPDRLFLHTAMLAAGATFENKKDSLKISDELAELSEALVFKCFRQSPSIYVIQGLIILSWRSLALGCDHFGWTFLSMAAGMAVHLRLHVLALDEFDTISNTGTGLADVQTFWSFYMTDRTSISILGRNCMLPWRRVNVPAIETFFPNEGTSLAQVSFTWQCKLCFSSTFETLTTTEQVSLLIATHENLSHFFKSRDQRLAIKRGATEKPVLLFHMAYQMAILVTMPPFLRLFSKMRNENPNTSQLMPVVLQSLTAAATAMVRLVSDYYKIYGFQKSNPLLIHHLLSACIVHLMNTTTKSFTLRRFSTRSVRKCLALFAGIKIFWPSRSQKSVDLIKVLARRWDVEFALPEDTNLILEMGFTSDFDPPGKRQSHQDFPEKGTGSNVSLYDTSENTMGPFDSLFEEENDRALKDLLYGEDGQNVFPMNNSLLDHGCPDMFPMFQDFGHFGDNLVDLP